MKTKLLALSLLLTTALLAIVPSPPFTGQVTLELSVPGPLVASNRFVVVGSPDLSVPTTNWLVLTNVAGNVTNINLTIPAVQAYYFSTLETNQFGIGPFGPVAAMELPRVVTSLIRQVR